MAMFGRLGLAKEAVVGPVTRFIASQNIWFFTLFSVFVDYYVFLVLPLSLIVFYKKFGRRRVTSLVLSLLLLYLAVPYLKVTFGQSRPCNEYLKTACPMDYSFPSGHTAVAFVFAFLSLGTVAFPFYYISAFLIAVSRVYMGVHFLNDVVGGMVVGIFSYLVSEKVIDACLRYAGG
jgi:undecaprenyl-diphosphatase